jgi:hypothetical protein
MIFLLRNFRLSLKVTAEKFEGSESSYTGWGGRVWQNRLSSLRTEGKEIV